MKWEREIRERLKVSFNCTYGKDGKINFPVIFYVFSYQESCKIHSFNFPIEKYFPTKTGLAKRKEFLFSCKISCQQNIYRKIKFTFLYFTSLHFFKEPISYTTSSTIEQSLRESSVVFHLGL